MGLFSRRSSYKRLVEEVARDAFSTDISEIPGLSSWSEDFGGYALNALEWLAAVLFLTQLAFRSLDDPENYHKARDYLAHLMFAEIEESYSKSEMRSFVVPVLEKRHAEYESILDGVREPGKQIRSVGSRMLGHVIGETVDETRANMAILFLSKRLTMEPAKRLKALDRAGQIKW